MNRIEINDISGFLEPWIGLADDEEALARYERIDTNDSVAVRSLISVELKSNFDSNNDVTKLRLKEALSCGLQDSSTDFLRLFYAVLPPLSPPSTPRDFFVWLWEELFPDDTYTALDLSGRVVEQLPERGILAKAIGAQPGVRPIVTARMRNLKEFQRGV